MFDADYLQYHAVPRWRQSSDKLLQLLSLDINYYSAIASPRLALVMCLLVRAERSKEPRSNRTRQRCLLYIYIYICIRRARGRLGFGAGPAASGARPTPDPKSFCAVIRTVCLCLLSLSLSLSLPHMLPRLLRPARCPFAPLCFSRRVASWRSLFFVNLCFPCCCYSYVSMLLIVVSLLLFLALAPARWG